MDDLFGYKEVLKVFEDYDYEIAIVLLAIWLCVTAYIAVRHHNKGKTMSKRRMQTRNKHVKDRIGGLVSSVLERAVARKELKRREADYWYKRLSKIGLYGLGYDHVFGKPWWQKTSSNTKKLKSRLRTALTNKGIDVSKALTLMQRKKVEEKKKQTSELSSILKAARRPF